MSFSTTLSYATDDGSITASYIIALLMSDLNNGKNTSLVIDGQRISISNDKLFLASISDTGLMIGLPFVGFSVAAVLCGVIICAVLM